MDPVLEEMIRVYHSGRQDARSSLYWQELNRKNIAQLQTHGYENFKQTVARNYFTWVGGPWDPQVRYFVKSLPLTLVLKAFGSALVSGRHALFTTKESIVYNFTTLLLWHHLQRREAGKILAQLAEPEAGNPPAIRVGGRNVSQDLLHSALEYQAILEGVGDPGRIRTVIELGAGYGRTAYVIMKMRPEWRYVVVDIPPALYLSQRYMCAQFPKRRVFRFREFQAYRDIAKEFEAADLAFLLPDQLELLPDKAAELFLAIDCLHEMRPEQINAFFSTIDRLTRGWLYFRCWKETRIPYDNVTLKEADYPVRLHWRKIFWRDCDFLIFPTVRDRKIVEERYFETLLAIADPSTSPGDSGVWPRG